MNPNSVITASWHEMMTKVIVITILAQGEGVAWEWGRGVLIGKMCLA